MADVTIKVRANGPYVVEGDVQLVDKEGNAFPTDPAKPLALCRCGESKSRPFCDGSHRTSGFTSGETAPGE